jgi:integrase
MRLPHHLVRSPSGIFHFRLKVPARLHATMGLRVIKQSLRTRDANAVRIYSYGLSPGYSQLFAAHRETLMAASEIKDILARVGAVGGKKFDIQFDAATGMATRVTTDGTAADNAAAIQAMQVRAAQLAAAMPLAPMARRTKGKFLKEAIQEYDDTEGKNLKPNTRMQRQRACKSFVAALGPDVRIDAIDRPMASGWTNMLLKSHRSKRYVANMVSHLAQVFDKWVRDGEVTDNCVRGLVVMKAAEKEARRDEGFSWEPFEEADLKKMFDPANLVRPRKEHIRWGVLIGLYTGARLGEVAQIFLRDFEAIDDKLFVRITNDKDGQRVKTKNSKRLVPIHPDLVRLGLWDRVSRLRQSGEERLFPTMRIDSKAGNGNAISKGFSYYIASLGIKPRRAAGTVGLLTLARWDSAILSLDTR